MQKSGYCTILAATSAECLKNSRRRAIDLILSPLDLPGHTPADCLAFFQQEFPHIRVAVLGAAPEGVAAAAIAHPETLVQSVRNLIG